MVAFDLWRVDNGQIAEHWDGLMPRFEQTASGRSQTDGPTKVRTGRDTGQQGAGRRVFGYRAHPRQLSESARILMAMPIFSIIR